MTFIILTRSPIVSGFNAPTVKQKADNLRVRLADDGAEPSSGDK